MLDVNDNKALQGAVLAMKAADRDLKAKINKATRATFGPVWKQQIESQLAGRDAFTAMLLKGVSVSAGNPPSLRAATSTRKIGDKKRLSPADNYYLAEFGADRAHVARYERKSRTSNGRHTVQRRTNTGLPRRIREGRVVYPAFAEIAPRIAALWVQLIIRTYAEAAEGK